jgi:hypothetical protein
MTRPRWTAAHAGALGMIVGALLWWAIIAAVRAVTR